MTKQTDAPASRPSPSELNSITGHPVIEHETDAVYRAEEDFEPCLSSMVENERDLSVAVDDVDGWLADVGSRLHGFRAPDVFCDIAWEGNWLAGCQTEGANEIHLLPIRGRVDKVVVLHESAHAWAAHYSAGHDHVFRWHLLLLVEAALGETASTELAVAFEDEGLGAARQWHPTDGLTSGGEYIPCSLGDEVAVECERHLAKRRVL